jgi:long-chain acyl-CoA synthetase
MATNSDSFILPEVPYYDLLRASAERYPDKTAVIFREQRYSYRALEALSNRLAHALLALGVRKSDRVILATYNRPEFIVSFYAVAKVGGVISPMNPSYKAREIEHQVADTEATVALVDQAVWQTIQLLRPRLPALKHLICFDHVVGADYTYADLVSQSPEISPRTVPLDVAEDLLALPYSSGTTSRPKGVMLTHRNLVCSHLQYTRAGRVTPEDVSLIFLPYCHVYGLMLMGGAIAAGATQVVMERYDLAQALRLTQQHRITLFYASPPVLVDMANYPQLADVDLRSVKYINSGGAPLPDEVAQKVRQRTEVYVAKGYGMTEASLSGNWVPGEERKIVDPETGERELEINEPGEIIIRGPHVMKGYWKDPQRTAQVLRNGWLYTGDIGVVDERGRIKIVDRKKELIKYKGFAVSPTEVEGVLFEHPAVADCAVVGKPDPQAGELPVAYVRLKEGQHTSSQELIAFVAERVAGYKKIHQAHLVSAIPRNSHGKILKGDLQGKME